MTYLLDSSVLVAAVVPSELEHAAGLAILQGSGKCIYSQAIAERFSTLTGGRVSQRISPAMAAAIEDMANRTVHSHWSGG